MPYRSQQIQTIISLPTRNKIHFDRFKITSKPRRKPVSKLSKNKQSRSKVRKSKKSKSTSLSNSLHSKTENTQSEGETSPSILKNDERKSSLIGLDEKTVKFANSTNN